MLRNSFALFPGIGPILEEKIWSFGITDWSHLFSVAAEIEKNWQKSRLPNLSLLREAAKEWTYELEKENFLFFASRLPNRDLWKLWKLFPHKYCYLDIETTGIDSRSVITVTSFYFEGKMHTFQRGKDLEFMLDVIKEDHILVSYNGRRFDVPFIEKEFTQKIPNLHLDLMNVLHEMGIKGGLKKSEEILGMNRSPEISKVDGRMAPLLWFDYLRNQNLAALDLLIKYNREDTKNLELILAEIFRRKAALFQELYSPPKSSFTGN